MTQPGRLHLFQGYGVELEYMIVDKDTLAVMPICAELLKLELGEYGSDFENGMITWSNELVLHVVELKSTRPEQDLPSLQMAFSENVKSINTLLRKWNAQLMPTAAHPFMDPEKETQLWTHDSGEVYAIYNKIFDCRGHGWSNLQSTHLNLPFYDDEEFAKIHAAIRVVLPLLPALCASSPVIGGRITGSADTRLKYYKINQQKIPCITGRVIPEAIYSKRTYTESVYNKIKDAVAPYDPENVLNPVWVNSRGAIPRFDRGSVEIRLMDVQECPRADLAIVAFVVEVIRALVQHKFASHETQAGFKTDTLAKVLELGIEHAEEAMVRDSEYLAIFGMDAQAMSMQEVWKKIYNRISVITDHLQPWRNELETILNHGTLSGRIRKALKGDASGANLRMVYGAMCTCLAENRMYIPE